VFSLQKVLIYQSTKNISYPRLCRITAGLKDGQGLPRRFSAPQQDPLQTGSHTGPPWRIVIGLGRLQIRRSLTHC